MLKQHCYFVIIQTFTVLPSMTSGFRHSLPE